MARITIDDDFYTDARIKALSRRLGSERLAAGTIIEAIFLAQKFWYPEKLPIPIEIWKSADLDLLIEVQLAKPVDGGIYLCGSEERFEWLFNLKATRSYAGVKSAEARLKKFGSSVPINASNSRTAAEQPPNTCSDKTEQPPNSRRTEPNVLTLTLTPTLINLNTVPEPANADPDPPKKIARVKKPKDPAKSTATWEAYAKAYRARYATDPIRDAKANSQCCKIVDSIGSESAVQVAEFFVSLNENWLTLKKHPLDLLLKDLQKYNTEYRQSLGAQGNGAIPAHLDMSKLENRRGW